MITVDSLKVYLPQYLSEPEQKKLIEQIKEFTDNPSNSPYYGFVDESLKDSLLQGDGINNKLVFFDNGQTANAPGIILTNTCDMFKENQRALPLNISYAPIFNLQKFEDKLTKEKNKSFAQSVTDKIRKQWNTSYFYLPDYSGLGYEGFVHFDKLNSKRNDDESYSELLSNRVFSLSQFGLYLFLFKLSIHFTRLKEDIVRHDIVEKTA